MRSTVNVGQVNAILQLYLEGLVQHNKFEELSAPQEL
jgi:hypothetical protein